MHAVWVKKSTNVAVALLFLHHTFLPVPVLQAAQLGDFLGNPSQSFTTSFDGQTASLSENEIPSGSINLEGLTLQAVELTPLPANTKIQTRGYNSEGRNHLPGYVTFKPGDGNHFSYRYDLGAGSGAAIDVSLIHSEEPMDLSEGFQFRLKRVNDQSTSSGFQEMSVIFVDSNSAVIEKRIQLSSGFQDYHFDLEENGFLSGSVQQIILSHSFDDLDSKSVQKDRRGEIFVEVGGVNLPTPVNGEAADAGGLYQFSEKPSLTASGFIKKTGSVPGFITLLDEAGTDENIRAFRYDVGGSPGASVLVDIFQGSAPVDLGAEVVLGMKNSGNGARALVRIEDNAGIFKEFILNLSGQFQNFRLDLSDVTGSGFNPAQVSKLTIEVDRKLSPQRRGRIDFYVPAAEEPVVEEPFTQLKPVITDAQIEATGLTQVTLAGIEGAVIYHVQVASDSQFQNILHEGFPQDPVEVLNVAANGGHYFRVRASKNTAIEEGPVTQWSETVFRNADLISDKKPAVTSVSTGIPSGVTRVEFTLLGTADLYHVQIARDAAFSDKVHEGFPGGNFEAVDLSQNGSYYARVRGLAIDSQNNEAGSLWSEPFAFNRGVVIREIFPDPGLQDSDLTHFPEGEAGPLQVMSVGPGGDAFDLASVSERGVILDFKTGTQGWSGGGFRYDSFDTPAVKETGDLSSLEELIFEMKGPVSEVKFEIIDKFDQRSTLQLKGIHSNEFRRWRIPVSMLTGIDLSAIQFMFFIVEGEQLEGALHVNHIPAPKKLGPSAGLTTDDITDFSSGILEGENLAALLGTLPVEGASISHSMNDRGLIFSFDTGAPGGLKGDIESVHTRAADGLTEIEFAAIPEADFYQVQAARDADFKNIVHTGFPGGTTDIIDLGVNGDYFVRVKGYASHELGFGFITDWSDAFAFTRNSGDPDPYTQLQPEVTSVQINNDDGTGLLEFTAVEDSVIYQVQIARDEAFTEIVHQGFPASGMDLFTLERSGDYYVRVRGSKNVQIEDGPASQWSDTLNFTADLNFEDPPVEQPAPKQPEPYQLSAAEGWAVSGLDFDDPATDEIREIADFSALSDLVIGIQADVSTIRFVIEDNSGKRGFVEITGILPNQEQIWAIPLSLFPLIDLAHVQRMFTVIQGDQLAGDLTVILSPE